MRRKQDRVCGGDCGKSSPSLRLGLVTCLKGVDCGGGDGGGGGGDGGDGGGGRSSGCVRNLLH